MPSYNFVYTQCVIILWTLKSALCVHGYQDLQTLGSLPGHSAERDLDCVCPPTDLSDYTAYNVQHKGSATEVVYGIILG